MTDQQWRAPLTGLLSRRAVALVLAAFCFSGLGKASNVYAAYTYSKIVDTATTLPGSSSLFTEFSDVAYDGQNVAFIGTSSSGPTEGVYQWNGAQLGAIAKLGDSIPSAATSFTDFANVSLDAGRVAFQGAGGTLQGVYTNLGGSLRRVADSTMTMPGSTARFRDLLGSGTPSFDVAIDGSNIAFSGFGLLGSVFDEGVYRESGGVLSVVANRSTTFPGQSQPSVFFRGEIDADEGHVLFEPDGLFTTHGAPAGQFRKVFDRDSSLPGLTPPVTVFSPNTFSLDNGTTAFIASRGVSPYDDFLYIQQPNGVTRRVMDETEINPVTNNAYSDLSNYYSLSNGRVLFSAWSLLSNDSIDAIYLSNDVGYDPIISDFDALDGKNLTDLSVFKDSLVDRDFVFEASFSDGSKGLYLAKAGPEIPSQTLSIEPAFDVQLRPGNQYPIGDGMTTLVIDGGSGTNFPVLQVLAEFSLSGIPAGADVLSAQLKLDATSSSSSSLTINAAGYSGDGLASLSDEFTSTTPLGSKAGPFTVAGDVTINLNADFIESLLGDASHLGLRLSSATVGPYVNIASLESTGVAPTLVIQFATTQPGDFDLDADVDGDDFLVWQRGLGANYDAGHLEDWKTNFGAPPAELAAVATHVPEPSAAMLAMLAILSGRFAVGRGRSRDAH